ncbi:hypothetical protein [Rhodococcus rhodochrous]|uniref:hypothetical protein n=1 Tax=Rhodococcus rhodochrous TaxID=1829 RepID=UPI0016768A7B|nr:hypothetical protein [Rhodococcus rhodochrous]
MTSVTIVPLARALLRANYRLLREPFVLAERHLLPAVLDDTAPTRLAYQRLLIDCDRVAARLLRDESAARAARQLQRRHMSTRYGIARRQHAADHHRARVLAWHRARFLAGQPHRRT